MTDPIAKVTLESAAEQIKLKIQSAFVELIPEAQWKEMIAAELKKFTTDGTSYNTYSGQHAPTPSELSKICREVFSAYIKEQIKEVLASPDWVTQWQPGKQDVSNAIKSWLTENAPALIQSTVQALAASAAQNLVTSMKHL